MSHRYRSSPSSFNNQPVVEVRNTPYQVELGWSKIIQRLQQEIDRLAGDRKMIVVEPYQGVIHEEVSRQLIDGLRPDHVIFSEEAMYSEETIRDLVYPDVTDDRIFGMLSNLTVASYFDPERLHHIQQKILQYRSGTILIYGYGAAFIAPHSDLLIYADMARWEIQLRMRRHQVDNLGLKNRATEDWMLLYKQGYFVDWRVCDRLKVSLFDRWDYLLDTNDRSNPKLIEGKAILEGLAQTVKRPFSVVPFFDPGPWGGQWMKEVCNLDPEAPNYAWCFNGVPEENSLLLKFGDSTIEIPSINLVFRHPKQLLGLAVYQQFGAEFPIRFDFLDTMQGGHLSLQVHPLTSYIREHFGMAYTQDESYYLMDAGPDATVYLGLKEGIDPEAMIHELEAAQAGNGPFTAEKYVQTWPVKKHDHMLIPAGTIHCSGKNSMVLEISATPYIFTFKLWDWGRLGMDGRPRPINIEHGKQVIQWDRTTEWTRKNLVNRIVQVNQGDGWLEERTGLHESEFIETRRHWFTKITTHYTNDGIQVICLIEGDEVIVESPADEFEPFIVHYAEVFIVPATIGTFTIRPYGPSEGLICATLKGYVRI